MTTVVSQRDGARLLRETTPRAERPIVIAVGMHRSGTSLCSNVLHFLGVDMADEAGAYPSNEHGHYERWDLARLQDEALALLQREYQTPFHDYPLPAGWWSDFRMRPIIDKCRAETAALLARPGPVGFKDPRTTRLLPMWKRIFAELGVVPRFVICLRDPAHVAISLHKRDGLDPATGQLRTVDYIVDALRHTYGYDRCFIQYDDWFPDPLPNLYKLKAFLNLDMRIDPNDLTLGIESIVHPDANQSSQSALPSRQLLVRHFFDMVSRYADSDGRDEALDAQLSAFIRNYLSFRHLLGPSEVQHRAAAARQAAAEQQTAALAASLRAAETGRATAQAEHAAAAAALAAERQTTAQLKADLAALRQAAEASKRQAAERDEDLATLRETSLRDRQSATTRASAQTAQLASLAAALETAEAERATAQAERGAVDSALAAEQQTIAHLQTELARLRQAAEHAQLQAAEEVQRRVAAHEQAIATLREAAAREAQTVATEAQALSAQVNDLTAALQAVKAELTTAQGNFAAAEVALAAERQTIAELQETIATIRKPPEHALPPRWHRFG